MPVLKPVSQGPQHVKRLPCRAMGQNLRTAAYDPVEQQESVVLDAADRKWPPKQRVQPIPCLQHDELPRGSAAGDSRFLQSQEMGSREDLPVVHNLSLLLEHACSRCDGMGRIPASIRTCALRRHLKMPPVNTQAKLGTINAPSHPRAKERVPGKQGETPLEHPVQQQVGKVPCHGGEVKRQGLQQDAVHHAEHEGR